MSPRHTDTRQRAVDAALELFTTQGYEQTSLREISERLGITKAALYYHFPSKEALLQAIVTGSLVEPVDEIVAWSESQPRSLETRKELLRRIAVLVQGPWSGWIRFAQLNQHTLSSHPEVGEAMQRRMLALLAAIIDPDAELHAQVRMLLALFTVYLGNLTTVLPAGFVRRLGLQANDEEVMAAAMDVAEELVAGN